MMGKISFFQKIMPYLKNKYVVACLVFVVFVSSGVYNRIQNSREINRLEKEIRDFKKETEEIKKQIKELGLNDKNKKNFARKNYGMTQENEEVFVFVNE